jgi:hypothetical protein
MTNTRVWRKKRRRAKVYLYHGIDIHIDIHMIYKQVLGELADRTLKYKLK